MRSYEGVVIAAIKQRIEVYPSETGTILAAEAFWSWIPEEMNWILACVLRLFFKLRAQDTFDSKTVYGLHVYAC